MMNNRHIRKKARFSREIFRTGEYIRYFKPEHHFNPFRKIYDQKKRDALSLINASKEPKNILDVGGGRGRLSLALAKLEQNNVFLADISFDMLKRAEDQGGRLENVKFVKADAHDLPFCNNAFDYVVGLDLFCHLNRPKDALREFHRVLKGDGMLILDSTNSRPLWALFYPRYLGKNPLNWLKIIRHKGVYPGWETIVKHYPKRKFLTLLGERGFQVIKTLAYGPVICPKWHLAVTRKRP